MAKKEFDIKEVVSHYIKLAQSLRDDKITVSALNQLVAEDATAFHTMYENEEITKEEFDSVLITLNEFEDMFVEIIERKQKIIQN